MTKGNRKALLVVGGLGAALLTAPRGMAAPGLNQSAPASPSVTAGATGNQRQDPAPRPLSQSVTLHLRETPLRTALQMLFAGSGLQYAVELTVPNYPITLDIRDVPFSTALQILLHLSPGTTYRKEGDIYLVGMRQPAPVPTSFDSEPSAPVESAAREQWEKIPLDYLHPAIAALVLNGRLIPTEDQVQPGSGGQGGYGNGANGLGGNGLSGVGSYGSLSGGLGAVGYGSYGSGYGNGYTGFGNGYGSYGNGYNGFGQGLGANVIVPGSGNSVIAGPQPRRF